MWTKICIAVVPGYELLAKPEQREVKARLRERVRWRLAATAPLTLQWNQRPVAAYTVPSNGIPDYCLVAQRNESESWTGKLHIASASVEGLAKDGQQIVAAEIRVIDCDSDLDLTPVQRVARMLNKGYLCGSHYLPHDAQVTQKSGKTFLTELNGCSSPALTALPKQSAKLGISYFRGLPEFPRGLGSIHTTSLEGPLSPTELYALTTK